MTSAEMPICEEWRIKHEPWQTYLQSIFDNMKTDYLFIK